MHKRKAFARFRAVPGETDAFLAWFAPEYFIVDRVASFFVRRFAGIRWAIVTPYRRAPWDGEALVLGAGGRREEAPGIARTWNWYTPKPFSHTPLLRPPIDSP